MAIDITTASMRAVIGTVCRFVTGSDMGPNVLLSGALFFARPAPAGGYV